MAPTCSRPSTHHRPLPICGSFRRFRFCGAPGFVNTMPKRGACGGAKPRICLLPRCAPTRPMIQKLDSGNKRSQTWTGYKVHVTETCDEDEIHLITHVETTLAGVTDSDLSAPIHEALAQRTLLPGEHFLDSGYVDADLLVRSQKELGIEVIGPVRPDSRGPGTSWSGLRCGSLSGELASTAGDLPARSYQYMVDSSYGCLGQPGDQCQIFPYRLPALCSSLLVYESGRGSSTSDPAYASRSPNAATHPRTADHSGVEEAL